MPLPDQIDQCNLESAHPDYLSPEIPAIVGELTRSCELEGCFAHVNPIPLPSPEAVSEVIDLARRVLFPGYFTAQRIDRINLEYYLGLEVARLFERLADQITWAVRHDCYRYELACSHCEERGRAAAADFIARLPRLRQMLDDDVRAAYDGDPAASGHDEIIFSYPGLYAVTVHRIAHLLHQLEVPLLPRIMSEQAHSATGIDIHPAARIGHRFFIDHGTGLVIGSTAVIGDRVRLYQGVTLGALSVASDKVEELRTAKRHPTIEDEVVVYAGATILGGETTIGTRSVIGGNVWLTESVPPDSKVILKTPELVYLGRKRDNNGGKQS